MTFQRAGATGLGAARLLVAGGILLAVTYLLAWRLLYGGLAGSDSLFHLDLASWVASTFPGIDWWYQWDGNGIPYREGYPLAVHWLTVLLSRGSGLGLPEAMQVMQFLINPLCALGIYWFCAWRLGRPLAGLVAGVLYLLSPITWTFLVDWGFYSNQAATVLVMPALAALDVFAEEWREGRRGLRYRVSALSFIGLATVLGLAGPAVVGAPLLAVPVYALFMGSGRQALRWLLLATPALGIGFALLSAFWALPLQAWLSVVAGRQPPRVYSTSLYHLWTLGQVLQTRPLQVHGNIDIYDRTSLSPAVTLPALAGVLSAIWDRRARVFAALAAGGLALMTAQWIYALVYPLPLLPYVFQLRVGVVLVSFMGPLLAGLGLLALPQLVAARLLRPRPGLPARTLAAALALAGLALAATSVGGFAHYVSDSRDKLAYGPFQADQRDVWEAHHDDACVVESNALCDSATLTAAFNVTELTAACLTKDGTLREDVPICAALRDPKRPTWSPSDDGIVAATLSWCQGAGAGDKVCDARYSSFGEQLESPRRPQVGCLLESCNGSDKVLAAARGLYGEPPERAALDAHADILLKGFHYLTGGGQVDSYNFQLLPSPELNSFAKDSLLAKPGATVKGELAQALGLDAVTLAGSQASLAGDYAQLGWTTDDRSAGNAAVMRPPVATGIAEQRGGRAAVLVVGALQSTPSNPYNAVFEHAAQGMIPYADGWLVKGRSPYIDDYSDQELAGQRAILLLAYRYHDANAAWQRLDRYVRAGGSLYVETGWQYADPDWDAADGFAPMPVSDLRWGPLDPSGSVVVGGSPASGWGSFSYQGGGWGASSAGSLRPGAEAMVTVGGRIAAARWEIGSGRVFWSGMNLLAHQDATGSDAEGRFLAEQWSWLLRSNGTVSSDGARLDPQWNGDVAVLPLQPTSGSAVVLFKESLAPGWTAELRWPGGSQRVPIEDAEADFMLVRLGSVPAGASLVFSYGPATPVYAAWAVSALTLFLLMAWLFRPQPFTLLRRRAQGVATGLAGRIRTRWEEE